MIDWNLQLWEQRDCHFLLSWLIIFPSPGDFFLHLQLGDVIFINKTLNIPSTICTKCIRLEKWTKKVACPAECNAEWPLAYWSWIGFSWLCQAFKGWHHFPCLLLIPCLEPLCARMFLWLPKLDRSLSLFTSVITSIIAFLSICRIEHWLSHLIWDDPHLALQ